MKPATTTRIGVRGYPGNVVQLRVIRAEIARVCGRPAK